MTKRPLTGEAGAFGGKSRLSLFRSERPHYQYLNDEQKKRLIRDYRRARDAYLRGLKEAEEERAELIKLGVIDPDHGKSEE